jgi:membrane protease YdiL (CAAX protease family)
MKSQKSIIERYSLLLFFVLTFLISWGGIVLAIGLGGVLGTEEVSEEIMPLLYIVTLLGPSVAGLLMIGLVHGKGGYREFFSRLFQWRVSVRWYAIALLVAPVLFTAVLLFLSLFSPDYIPGIFVTEDKKPLLISGLVAGLLVGIFEETGWTGFATPQFRERRGILGSGLSIGLLWGLWHLPLFSGSNSSTGMLPGILYLCVLLFSYLPAFRVLMVWVYNRTGSLLVVMLMHASLTASILIFPPQITPVKVITYDLVFGALLWILVCLVAITNGGKLERRESSSR